MRSPSTAGPWPCDIDEGAAIPRPPALGAPRVGPGHRHRHRVARVGAQGRPPHRDEVGPVVAWVNNAGIDIIKPFVDSTEEEVGSHHRGEPEGTIACCHAVIGPMIERREGRIVSIASDAGRVGSSGEAVYSAAKGGVIAFTKTLCAGSPGRGSGSTACHRGPPTRPCSPRSPKYSEAARRPGEEPSRSGVPPSRRHRAGRRVSSSATVPDTSPARPCRSAAASPWCDHPPTDRRRSGPAVRNFTASRSAGCVVEMAVRRRLSDRPDGAVVSTVTLIVTVKVALGRGASRRFRSPRRS